MVAVSTLILPRVLTNASLCVLYEAKMALGGLNKQYRCTRDEHDMIPLCVLMHVDLSAVKM